MNNRNKILIVIVVLIGLVGVILGGTYAYWSWVSGDSQKTMVTFTTTADFSCSADVGGSISNENVTLAPTDCDDPDHVIKKTIHTSVNISGNDSVDLSLKLVLDSLPNNQYGDNLFHANLKYVVTKNENSCTSDIVREGSLNQLRYAYIVPGTTYTSSQDDTYYLYIWLDKEETFINYMNSISIWHIEGECLTSAGNKAYLNTVGETDAFKEDAYRTKITSVDFVDYVDTTGATKTYDLGTNSSKPITGWLVQNSGTDTYKLYVGSEEEIYAKSFNYFFKNMTALQSVNFGSLNTSELYDTSGMFMNDSSLTTINWGSFDTSNVTNMQGMFLGCSSLTTINLSGFNTSNVTNMVQMFQGDTNLTSLDLSSFNTPSLTKFNLMFFGCKNLSSINFGDNFDTSKVESFNTLFAFCTSLVSLDLSSFDTSSAVAMASMFRGSTNLEHIYVSNLWNTSSVTSSGDMFLSTSKLPNFNSSIIDKTNAHYNTGGYLEYKALSPKLVTAIANQAVMDNISSDFVTNSNGVKFNDISSDTNGKGVYIRSGTENNPHPIYYYRGAVTNNNVLFANFCWKIVRTTDTGGVKLIYNGTPSSGKCTNTTGEATQLASTSAFNSSSNSPAYVGYMYGTVYTYELKPMTSISEVYQYGKTFTYSNGTYTLSSTGIKSFAGTAWASNYNQLSNNHYTCFTTGTTCSSIYYIFYTNDSTAYYITLTGGKSVEDAISEMLSNSSNATSSTIKTAIDNWYSSNMTSYTGKLEDTIWCNDRNIYQLNGWNPNGGDTTKYLRFGGYERVSSTYSPSLSCNKNDAFTTDNVAIGNGKLTYPVGLITSDEIMLGGGKVGTANSTYYLYTNQAYLTGSPVTYYYYQANEFGVSPTGFLGDSYVGRTGGVRPAVSLKPGVRYASGDGTSDTPYIVE